MTRKRRLFELGLSLMLGGAADIVVFGARIDTWGGPVALVSLAVGYVVVAVAVCLP